ncbi:MAG: hypothetical protein A4S09_13595 [Proteobacteria bacterium SG_bin7]|nr:MAG: hypothetical protein A4S09_13595 [Proteobacteria bacterium SG_bin7]
MKKVKEFFSNINHFKIHFIIIFRKICLKNPISEFLNKAVAKFKKFPGDHAAYALHLCRA